MKKALRQNPRAFSLNKKQAIVMTCKQTERVARITIAVDGHSSCGKSTLAKDLASLLDYTYIDTGSMYRAITLKMLQNDIKVENEDEISKLLQETRIDIKKVGDKKHLFMDGRDVENEIRTPEVAAYVSPVACVSSIRRFLVELQRQFGQQKGVVMEGRDIATVVFPKAELKLFVTADISIRAQRRHLELLEKGIKISRKEVEENLAQRDYIDSHRDDSPLIKHKDAILVDTTEHSRESQAQLAYEIACRRIRQLA